MYRSSDCMYIIFCTTFFALHGNVKAWGGGCCSLYMNIHGVEKKLLLAVLPRGCATICSEHVKKNNLYILYRFY